MMDINEIKEYLPQRYPFLLIDRVVELEPYKSIKAYKNVTVNEPFFDGHFPANPIMPGVLIIESMAQAAGVLGFKSMNKKPADGWLYLFAGADKTRFKKQVVPGDQLMLDIKVLNEKRGIWKFECKAFVDDTLAASAVLLVAEREM